MADSEYRDRWIQCTASELTIHAYYFPWGAKRIRYESIRSYRVAGLTAARGRGRIWGTANVRYWAGLDPQRPGKARAIILDLGRRVRPFLTPDDPDAVIAAIRRHTGKDPEPDPAARGPVI